MDKIILKCDVCGGTLTMQGGGQGAVCEYCGMKYAIPRLQEKVQEIRGTVKVEGVVKTENSDFEIKAGTLRHYHGKETTVAVPEHVKEIGSGCFERMKYLTSVSLPRGLTEIGVGAFGGCTGLTQLSLPQGLTTIGSYAFEGCTGLTQLSLPQGLTEIGVGAFGGCTGLTRLTLPQGVKAIGEDAFEGCTGLKEIIVAPSISPKDDGSCLRRDKIIIIDPISKMSDHFTNPSPWVQGILRYQDRCQHCGGNFEGRFFKKCNSCHKRKDY